MGNTGVLKVFFLANGEVRKLLDINGYFNFSLIEIQMDTQGIYAIILCCTLSSQKNGNIIVKSEKALLELELQSG